MGAVEPRLHACVESQHFSFDFVPFFEMIGILRNEACMVSLMVSRPPLPQDTFLGR